MMQDAFFCTVGELAAMGRENIPPQFISGAHLIYSSPATLAFNSPGAEGFGVKRAGLAIPDSIMLIVAPGCCGRNTSLISSMREYDQRFFYLMMDETDIVTGRHLKKIPKAVKEICDSLAKKPSVVMICITCVDALLGTDMERVCRKAEEAAGLPVRPCYMYALTREGRKPPMVHVRQSLYSLLEPRKKKGNVVNLLGFFSPLVDDCELYDLLHQAGVKTIHEISACRDYEEYQTMSEANFNLVLHPEARFAAEDFHDRLKIPFIELTRLYQIDKIGSQYRAFGKVLGVTFDDQAAAESAQKAVDAFAGHPENYYDFILMDVQMPVMDGRTAARTIRAMKRADAGTVLIFALSADAFVEDERLSVESGMNAHYSKPVDFFALRRSVGEYLEKKGQVD